MKAWLLMLTAIVPLSAAELSSDPNTGNSLGEESELREALKGKLRQEEISESPPIFCSACGASLRRSVLRKGLDEIPRISPLANLERRKAIYMEALLDESRHKDPDPAGTKLHKALTVKSQAEEAKRKAEDDLEEEKAVAMVYLDHPDPKARALANRRLSEKKAAVERATAAIRSIERLIYRADIGVNEEERRRIEKEVTELERRRKEDERARQRAAEEHRERLRQQTDKSAEGTPRDMIDAMQKELEEKASPDTD